MQRLIGRNFLVPAAVSMICFFAIMIIVLDVLYFDSFIKDAAVEMGIQNAELVDRLVKDGMVIKKVWMERLAAGFAVSALGTIFLCTGIMTKSGKDLMKAAKMADVFCKDVTQLAMLIDEKSLRCRYATPGTLRFLGLNRRQVQGRKADDLFRKIMSVEDTDPDMITIFDKLEKWDHREDLFIERFPAVNMDTGKQGFMRGRIYAPDRGDILVLMHDDTDIAMQEKILQEALMSATAATQAKSNFLNNMSHDIRTPMNAISGFVALLEKNRNNPEKVAEYTRKIRISSEHLLSLINEVLDMSRIESGNTVLVMSEFTVGNLLDEILPHIQSQSQAKRQFLKVRGDIDNPCIMMGDRLHIGQILINILSNAVKYTPEGGDIYVDVDLFRKAGGKTAQVKFSVTDTGYGIDADFIEHIFEPFAREDDRDIRKIQGTGLGMAITKNLVDLMGGTVSVTSEKGAGTRFTVELEFKLADSKAKSNTYFPYEDTGDLKTQEEDCIFAGMDILIAEDNDFNAQIIEELLTISGARCVMAKNGAEAVQIFVDSVPGTFDLIIMDVMMPVMDGHTATKKIRMSGHADAENVLIVAMTANAFADDVKKSVEAGMDVHVSKPLDMEVLEEVVFKLRTGAPVM